MPEGHRRLRLAELLGSLSLATDLGTGQPMGHGMRTCLLAVALANEMGFDAATQQAVYQATLLRFLGCTADASESSVAVGGDEIGFNRAMALPLNGTMTEGIAATVRHVGRGDPAPRRARLVLGVLTDTDVAVEGLAAHCEVAAMLAKRLGIEERVVSALGYSYERWDGKGYPSRIAGDQIPLEIRISSIARDIDLAAVSGWNPVELVTKRRGRGYDPDIVDAWLAMPRVIPDAEWDAFLAAEPPPHASVLDLTHALTVLADFVDLKSAWTRGHSRRVALLARAAAEQAGMQVEDVALVERAGLVHDLGRVGVENGIWDKPGPLSSDQWEQVRLHPYLTHRILSRCPPLEPLGSLAASHHERSDGSGYHRELKNDQVSPQARLLAAADFLDAATSDRPHRPAMETDAAFSVLRAEAKSGRLDPDTVSWVVSAAGGELERRRDPNPDGLTDREVEVLRLIATGATNREVAARLFISPKTAGRHVENIYAKIGVSSRAAAAVYAMGSGVLA